MTASSIDQSAELSTGFRVNAPSTVNPPWWLDAILLALGIAGAELGLHYLLLGLDLHLPTMLDSVVHGIALMLLVGPILSWTLYRRQLNGPRPDSIPSSAKSPHRRVRITMLLSKGVIGVFIGISLWNHSVSTSQLQKEIALTNLMRDQLESFQDLALLAAESSQVLVVPDKAIIESLKEKLKKTERVNLVLIEQLEIAGQQDTRGFIGAIAAKLPTIQDRDRLTRLANELYLAMVNDDQQGMQHKAREIVSITFQLKQMTHDAIVGLQAHSDDRHLQNKRMEPVTAGMLIGMMLMISILVIEPTIQLVRFQHDEVIDQNLKLQRLATVVERTQNSVIVTDAHRKITWVNDGFFTLTGYAFEEVRGKSPGSLLQFSKTDPLTIHEMREALDSGKSYRGEILNRSKDGREYWLDVDIQPQFDANGAIIGFMAIQNDVTSKVLERLRLQSTLAAVAEGIVHLDKSARIVECNPAASQILGKDQTQLLGTTLHDPAWKLIREDGSEFSPAEHPAVWTLYCGDPIRNFVYGIHIPNGQQRWISMSTEPIRDTDGQIIAAVASFADITAHRDQANRMELVVRGAGLGTWDWEIGTGKVAFNSNWAGMLGYELHEIQPNLSAWTSLVHPDDNKRIHEILQNHLAGETPEFHFEHRLRRKDGSWCWVLDAGRVTERDASGKPLRAVGVHVDISSQKEAEEEAFEAKQSAEKALREINALRSALDQHSLLSVADKTGKIIDVNTGFCRISGYTREELIGNDHRMLNSGVHPKEFWVNIWKNIASGSAWRGVVCNRKKNGEKYWVDSTIVPYRGIDGRVEKYVSIRFDVTAQKAAEVALIAAQEQAEIANAAKSEFLANMSHEIRTPMTAILGFTDMLASDGDRVSAPRKRLEYIDTIRRNGEYLLDIINDILDISKIEAGKMRLEQVTTQPAHLVHEVLSLMAVRAKERGLPLEMEFSTPLPATILSDPVRIRQILVNLVGNAIKFTPQGKVSLRVQCDPQAQQLNFSIVDTGIGMTTEQMERLFGAFAQADASTTRKFGGTGLGLRISKRLAQMLGGDICVSSQLGIGSTFVASISTGDLTNVEILQPDVIQSVLHLLKPGELPESEAPGNNSTPALDGMRVLLAEDGLDNQRLISHVLRKSGAIVKIVNNGRELVEALSVNSEIDGDLISPPPFDLVVTDMQMPEMDGYVAARLLRAKGSTISIVALTANAMSSDKERCLQAGCDDYATKPIRKNSLIDLCARLGRRTSNPTVTDEPILFPGAFDTSTANKNIV